ncbi:MAG: tetratricopeptide repeat protein [Planctomycetes bacterium]|nr:tetratricopeptide repeat protein [Planctomycetota bacterium]
MRISLSVAVVCALIGLACSLAGCQFTESFRERSLARKAASGEDSAQLTPRQAADAKISLARSLEQRGETDRALEAYREILDKDSKQWAACWRLAVLSDRRGNIQESEGYYRRALKAESKNADLQCDYGYSLYLQRRWAESEEHLRQAIALKSSHRRAHNNLGMLLAQTERYQESLAEFRKSGCAEAEAEANLAFVLTLNRRWDEAREHYQLALAANPESTSAKTGLEKLEQIVARANQPANDVVLAGHERPAKPQPLSRSAESTSVNRSAPAK